MPESPGFEHVLKLIQEDCRDDAAKLDGKPLSGEVIGESFGNLLAMVNALAGVLLDMLSGPVHQHNTSYGLEEMWSHAHDGGAQYHEHRDKGIGGLTWRKPHA